MVDEEVGFEPLAVALLYSRLLSRQDPTGIVFAADVPSIAADALVAGIDSRALRILAGMSPHDRWLDIVECLDQVGEELLPDLPEDPTSAQRLITEYWLLCLLGDRAPASTLLRLILDDGWELPKRRSLFGLATHADRFVELSWLALESIDTMGGYDTEGIRKSARDALDVVAPGRYAPGAALPTPAFLPSIVDRAWASEPQRLLQALSTAVPYPSGPRSLEHSWMGLQECEAIIRGPLSEVTTGGSVDRRALAEAKALVNASRSTWDQHWPHRVWQLDRACELLAEI